MNDKFSGRVWVLPDDIDTDIIIPTQYLALPDIGAMKKYAFNPLRPELAGKIAKGDILVCGKYFGCGSSREQAPEIIRELCVSCIIARSYARIFYRNAINNGLLVLENDALPGEIKEGDTIEVDLASNVITYGAKKYPIGSIPQNLKQMIESGGLVKYMKNINK